MPAERASPHLEIPAILISFVLAPSGCLVIGAIAWPIAILIGESLGVLSPDGDPADKGQFLAPLAAVACAGFGLFWLPVLLGLHATGKLSFWTVIPPAILLPSATVAAVALAGWAASGRNLLPWCVTSALLVLPPTAAGAIAFWGFYCFFTGHRFFTPPAWRRATPFADDAL